MEAGIRKAFQVYKYLTIVFSIAFWIYIVIDDWVFVQHNGLSLVGIGMWFVYFVLYLIGYSIYYWLATLIVILFYYKVIKRRRSDTNR